MENAILFRSLKQLTKIIKEEADQAIRSGNLQVNYETYVRWKAASFRYDEDGPFYGGTLTSLQKKSWSEAVRKINSVIELSRTYHALSENLAKVFGDELEYHTQFALDNFVAKVAALCLDRKFDHKRIDRLVEKLLGDLKGDPSTYCADVMLQGLVIRKHKIKLENNLSLRKGTKKDAEKPYAYDHFIRTKSVIFQMPVSASAVLEIVSCGRSVRDIIQKISETIALLRLFKVGSVIYLSYHIRSDSFLDPLEPIPPGYAGAVTEFGEYPKAALQRYTVDSRDISALKTFWQTMQPLIVNYMGLFTEGKDNHITIAYKRYCDSLLEDGVPERRIANAIMGLEALFMKPNETQELVYRLSNRTAKMLKSFDYKPVEAKHIIGDAYKIRNQFAHGGYMSDKQLKKLKKVHKDTTNLLLSTLDYLRVSIVAYMTVKIKKELFIDLIDASLVDMKADEQLHSILNTARHAFGIS
jgi:hypothetical protein